MTTQVSRVRAHLESGKTITPGEAIMVYGIFRLSSVIEDLRLAGMEIDTVIKWDAMGKQYGEYRARRPITLGSVVQIKKGYGMGLPLWVRRFKAAKVIGSLPDGVSLVRFVRGKNMADVYVNNKELINAD